MNYKLYFCLLISGLWGFRPMWGQLPPPTREELKPKLDLLKKRADSLETRIADWEKCKKKTCADSVWASRRAWLPAAWAQYSAEISAYSPNESYETRQATARPLLEHLEKRCGDWLAQREESWLYAWRGIARYNLKKSDLASSDLVKAAQLGTDLHACYQYIFMLPIAHSDPKSVRELAGYFERAAERMPEQRQQIDLFEHCTRLYQRAQDTASLVRVYDRWVETVAHTNDYPRIYAHSQRANFRASIGDYDGEKSDLQILIDKYIPEPPCASLFSSHSYLDIYLRLLRNAHARRDFAEVELYAWRFSQLNMSVWGDFQAELEQWKRSPNPQAVYWAASAKMHLNQAHARKSYDPAFSRAEAKETLLDIDTTRAYGFDPPMLQLYEAYAYELIGEPRKAMQRTNDFVERYPDWPDGYYLRMNLLHWRKQPYDPADKTASEKYRANCRERLDQAQR